MKGPTFFLVDKKALLKVCSKVMGVKQYTMNAEATSTSEATRMAGTSRSVFYKYKDSMYSYQPEATNRILAVQAVLYDRPGVLMSLVSEFYRVEVNVLTINRSTPVSGKATVSISTRISSMVGTIDELPTLPRNVDGVCSTDNITDQ